MNRTDKKQPWVKFYPSDWRADPKLRMCSFAARGLWMDMLALMHEAEPYGHLVVGGLVPDADELAGLLGGSAEEVEKLLTQLERRQVFSRTSEGVIYSRRMVRDQQKAEVHKAHGKLGGNPTLNHSANPRLNPDPTPGLTPGLSGGLTPGVKAQKPESRVQSQSPNKQLKSGPPAHAHEPAREGPPAAAEVRELMPKVTDPPHRWLHLSEKRETDDRDGVTHCVVGGTYLDIAARLCIEAAGINPVSWRGDWRPLIAWLKADADLERHILPVIRQWAARPRYTPPGSLEYFSAGVMKMMQEDAA